MADHSSNLTKALTKALKTPHVRPWLAVAAEVPASVLAHAVWGPNPIAAIGMTVASGALTCATWWASKGAKLDRRLHATGSAAAGATYLTAAAFTNPLGEAQLSLLAMGGAVAAGSWNVRKLMRKSDGQNAEQSSETGLLAKSLGKAKLALRKEPKVEPNKVTAPYKITAPGELTNEDIGRRAQHIATELGISPTALRIVSDPDNAAFGQFVIVPEDMLVDGAQWPGPSAFGGSITDPVVVGIYEDGDPEQFWFPADPNPKGDRNATHFLAAGMNGSGKSAGMTLAIVDALTRRDFIVWACDPSKGMQTFGPLLPYLDWVEMTQAGGEEMIDALSQVITARADELGRHGFKNWTPAAFEQLQMPYMAVWIEEAAKFFRNGTEMEGLVQEARSAGISVIISLQRPSSTSMPTDVREQLGGVLCFGVKGSTTADMALPDDVRDAGARPEAWENRKRGYNYLVAPGVDEERYAMKARTFTPPSDEEIGRVLAAAPKTPAGPTTTAAAGEAYANRTRYDGAPTPAAAAGAPTPEVSMNTEQKTTRDEQLLERQIERDVADVLGEDEGEGLAVAADPDQELAPVNSVWKFAEPPKAAGSKRSTEEAMAELMALLDERRAENAQFVGPRDFVPHCGAAGRIGRSRPWVSERLGELADAGIHLAETDESGVYRLLYPELASV
ncbi:plasmid transfer protein TraB [Streptomyces rugosispiralis]|uniref:Conjugal transfer protein TraB n=1 Tax=Streptomyces rugosispiralis TaxID=2967341 RepID=A0ABT1VDD4_9ACTN|nr:plasmid transfer protein TraB [Streptomyces rugosispiralis]MCQ8195424.1 conjugal transfer protein TraB [Streptomyces rugosispiralis]